MFATLMILLGCICAGLLIPLAIVGHYAGLRVVFVSAVALAVATALAAAGGALGWLLFALGEIPAEAITAGVISGFLAGLILGSLVSLRFVKPRDAFGL